MEKLPWMRIGYKVAAPVRYTGRIIMDLQKKSASVVELVAKIKDEVRIHARTRVLECLLPCCIAFLPFSFESLVLGLDPYP